MPPAYNHEHPSLGRLTARLFDEKHSDGTPVTHPTAHFRSIHYARIPARFRQSVLLDRIPEPSLDGREPRDFTEYGAACPQIPQPYAAAGGMLPGEKENWYDETSCLNLTISAPVSRLDSVGSDRKLLPVMVYVHGGALTEGKGHVCAGHETVKMVELSEREGMPVVAVSIGYRLNFTGFVACRDLLDELAEEESDEPPFNYGFHDQRAAFAWVRANIAGFGGDPDNVTAFGESAGAVSLHSHLTAHHVPLFRRVILQSASASTVPCETVDQADARYRSLLDFLGISAETGRERLAALRAVDVERLVDYVRANNRPTPPCFSPESRFHASPAHVPTYTNQGRLAADCPWLESAMVGDVWFEGGMFQGRYAAVSPGGFVSRFEEALGPDVAGAILEAYGISPDMDDNLFQTHAMVLCGDFLISDGTSTTALALAEGRAKPTYRWQFCLRNPFPGSPFSYTNHHWVEVYYQFMTFSTRMPRHRDGFLARQGEQMARMWVRFANGLEPMDDAVFEPARQKIMVCDELRGWQVRTREEDERVSADDPWGERRYRQLEVMRRQLLRIGQGEEEEAAARMVDDARRRVFAYIL